MRLPDLCPCTSWFSLVQYLLQLRLQMVSAVLKQNRTERAWFPCLESPPIRGRGGASRTCLRPDGSDRLAPG